MHRAFARVPLHFRLAFFPFLIATGVACSSGSTPSEGTEEPDNASACSAGDEKSCSCGASRGTRTCNRSGEWSGCACEDDSDEQEKDSEDEPGDQQPTARADAGTRPDAAKPSMDESHPLPCEVATVLTSRCGECHGQETAFGAPMPLVTWEDLQQPAPKREGEKTFERVLARAQDDRSPMPPAPHERLTEAELATLTAWVEAGTPQGAASCGLPDDAPPDDAPDDADAPEDCEEFYELRAHGQAAPDDKTKFKISSNPSLEGNQYHCFYFDPPYDSDSALFWYEPIIDNKAHLHHWIMYATDNKTRADGTSVGCNASQPGSYFVAGWAPGANNTELPSDVALQLPTGSTGGLILELHYYNDTGASQEDASGIRFCTGKKSKREHLAAVHTLGSEGICVQPGATQEVSGVCAPRTDMGDIHIIGLWPHMHRIANHQKLTVYRQDGGSEVIHDAPFDFNSQLYYPKDDVVLRPGDTLETRCRYTNDSTTQVHYGERTQDEMCYSFVFAWPAGALVGLDSGFGDPSTQLLNRCADGLSILGSCNGPADAPMNAAHPP